MREAEKGDEAAARELFDRFAPHFQNRLLHELPPGVRAKVAASDILQEAWIRAFRSLGRFSGDSEADFRQWLATIVMNRMRDAIRRFTTQRRNVGREDHAPRDVRAQDQTASAVAMAAEDRAAVWQAVERLPDEYRLILELTFRGGRTFVDAGAVLGKTPDATRKLFARALRALSATIESEGRGADGNDRP